MTSNQKWLVGIIAGVVLLFACLAVACVGVLGLSFLPYARSVINETTLEAPFPIFTEEVVPIRPTATSAFPQVTATPRPVGQPTPGQPTPGEPASDESLTGAQLTLLTLENHVIPINDPRDLAQRLEGKLDIPETLLEAPPTYNLGDTKTFWASNTNTNQNFQVNARLQYITPHLYFWIEEGVRFNAEDLKRLSETFENQIYPTNRDFFGSEWTPGIDNDPHLYILYARNIGATTAGYFSSADSVHPDAHRYSNAHEMFVINADIVRLDEDYIYSTVAHEFQHMIHWYQDRNEESWMNEGFSQLSQLLNGYDIGGLDWVFSRNPDLQLTHWPSSPESRPHYGASFLFWAYFLDRFGDEATKAVVAHPDNGMDSIDAVLADLNQLDARTGSLIQADDVFTDWTITNYLHDKNVEDGRFVYTRYRSAPKVEAGQEDRACSSDWNETTVRQYGADYIRLRCSGDVTLHFEGTTEVGVLPASAYSGSFAFWSNRADESNMTLTREFDFTNHSGPLTLTYRAWWDLEVDYDYLYLVVSEDGQTWQILEAPSGRARSEDPSGNAYGWGYNGQSGEWVEEQVDLSAYAGKKVQLRFEYVTDAAVNENGFLVDDIRIPEIDYSTDFEQGDDGWDGQGFVRIENRLPQQFRVTLIREGRTASVEYITLDAGQTASVPLQFGSDMRSAVVVVSGVTRFTTQEAVYRYRFEK